MIADFPRPPIVNNFIAAFPRVVINVIVVIADFPRPLLVINAIADFPRAPFVIVIVAALPRIINFNFVIVAALPRVIIFIVVIAADLPRIVIDLIVIIAAALPRIGNNLIHRHDDSFRDFSRCPLREDSGKRFQ